MFKNHVNTLSDETTLGVESIILLGAANDGLMV